MAVRLSLQISLERDTLPLNRSMLFQEQYSSVGALLLFGT
jgi:hypothetical protein